MLKKLGQIISSLSYGWIAVTGFLMILTLVTTSRVYIAQGSTLAMLCASSIVWLVIASPGFVGLLISRKMIEKAGYVVDNAFEISTNQSYQSFSQSTLNTRSIADNSSTLGFSKLSEDIAESNGKKGYVYLIQADTGYYKIGKTKDINDRLGTFNVKLPFPVEPIHIIECIDRHQMEKELHKKFASKRINGEWFDLSGSDVAYIKGIHRA